MNKHDIIQRLLEVIPPSSIEMNTFLALFDVQLTTDIATACITCGAKPELYINPEFVAQHCQSNEHLFMLVMHELYHVILGHTKLFAHPTQAHNIAFDAIINALLCNLCPDEAYTSFFTSLYASDTLPDALLRPTGANTPPAVSDLLHLLYDNHHSATYHDVFEAIARISPPSLSSTKLLGSHGNEHQELSAEMRAMIAEVTKNWENILPDLGQGNGTLSQTIKHKQQSNNNIRHTIARLMRLAQAEYMRLTSKQCIGTIQTECNNLVPNAHDRLYHARLALQGETLLYRNIVPQRSTNYEQQQATFVYLDTSGSMHDILPQLLDALQHYSRKHCCTIYEFSTEVHLLTPQMLKTNCITTTLGTDIQCVVTHLLSLPHQQRPTSVLLITDGEVGSPCASDIAKLQKSHIKFYCALAPNYQRSNLTPFVSKFVNLNI